MFAAAVAAAVAAAGEALEGGSAEVPALAPGDEVLYTDRAGGQLEAVVTKVEPHSGDNVMMARVMIALDGTRYRSSRFWLVPR